jgi:hypothetical protein
MESLRMLSLLDPMVSESAFWSIYFCPSFKHFHNDYYFSSLDSTGVRAIRTCVCCLEKLDPEIVPAAVAMAKNPQNKMAVKHVKLLMKEWMLELSNLMRVLDEMTDPRIFMHVSGNCGTLFTSYMIFYTL